MLQQARAKPQRRRTRPRPLHLARPHRNSKLNIPRSGVMFAPLVGAAVALLSLYKGKAEDRFGGGWSSLWRDDELPNPERVEP